MVRPLNLSKRNAKKNDQVFLLGDSTDSDIPETTIQIPVTTTRAQSRKPQTSLPTPRSSASSINQNNSAEPSPSQTNQINSVEPSTSASPIIRDITNLLPSDAEKSQATAGAISDEKNSSNKNLIIVVSAFAAIILLSAIVYIFYRIRINNLKSKEECNDFEIFKAPFKDSFQVVPTLQFLRTYEPEYRHSNHSQYRNSMNGSIHSEDSLYLRSAIVPMSPSRHSVISSDASVLTRNSAISHCPASLNRNSIINHASFVSNRNSIINHNSSESYRNSIINAPTGNRGFVSQNDRYSVTLNPYLFII